MSATPMKLASLFRRGRRREGAADAYNGIVARARLPVFFALWGVPDTLDGRFEVLTLHGFLVMNRLKAERAGTADFAQDLFDAMFADLDRAVRELGASDIGVGRHVKAMARGFYGRSLAYEQALAAGEEALADALRRNLFGTATPEGGQVAAASRYLRRQVAALAAVPAERFLRGEVPFAPVEAE